ncbi:MAG: glycosyltransferase family A protein [Patescibacteria group bacterium]
MLISVIIPVYNHEAALKRSLASIAQQTYKEIEVVIVDDGSQSPIQSLVSNFQFPIIFIHQNHLGAPAARNRGFRESKGDYVIFWDADVIAEPDMLQKMYQTLQDHPGASFSYSNFYFGKKSMPAQTFNLQALQARNFIHSTSLIRREAVVSWDESLKRFQDWDLWLTMAEQGKTGIWIPEYLFRVLPRRGGMSTWLPSFCYGTPWKFLPWIRSIVKEYEKMRARVQEKHKLA